MQTFERITGIVAPIDRPNVDTDAIIPKQFLKSIKRTGFGENLFDEWRYLDKGEPGRNNNTRPRNMDFVLNQPRYENTQVLLARDNFGCGSSREHAPWALRDFGIKAIIAPSFADIFFNNCCKNGVLPISMPDEIVDRLFEEVFEQVGYQLTVDLPQQSIITPSDQVIDFEFNPGVKERFINGLDDIGLTLKNTDRILEYEEKRKLEAPWLFTLQDTLAGETE